MPCEVVTMPTGGRAIICSTGPRKRCACGRPAPFLCDWKVPARRSGTCDAPLCATCATSPAEDKHLCTTHTRAFQTWQVTHPVQAAAFKGKTS